MSSCVGPNAIARVLVYAGPGTCPASVEGLYNAIDFLCPTVECSCTKDSSECLSQLQQCNENAQDVALIIPGGRDLSYLKSFGEEGCDIIVKFVHHGGSYLGVCAGAYFAAEFCEFERGRCLEVIGKRFLGFWKGKAVGSVSEGFEYKGNRGEKLMKILVLGNDEAGFCCKGYVNGGCAFVQESFDMRSSDTEVLARYCGRVLSRFGNNREGLPAAVAVNVESKGRVVLTGIHPELRIGESPVTKEVLIASAARNEPELRFMCLLLCRLGLPMKALPKHSLSSSSAM